MSNPASITLSELRLRKEKQFQQSIYDQGWNDCKQEVLKILKSDWTDLDAWVKSCDNYYIDKIKEL